MRRMNAEWRFRAHEAPPAEYTQLLRWFIDDPNRVTCPFSVHNLLRADRLLHEPYRTSTSSAARAHANGPAHAAHASDGVNDDDYEDDFTDDTACSSRAGTWFGPHHMCRLLEYVGRGVIRDTLVAMEEGRCRIGGGARVLFCLFVSLSFSPSLPVFLFVFLLHVFLLPPQQQQNRTC